MSTDVHAEHRPYLAALGDGELDLVPAGTREHVHGCDQCRTELEAHLLLGERLRAALRVSAPVELAPAGGRSRFLIPLAAAAAIALVVTGALLVTRPSSPDPLAAAVLVASRQPEYRSSDPQDIARWCTAQYGNRVPVVALAGLQPVGARMDWPEGPGIATVTYALDGHTVHLSWLPQNAGSAQPEAITVAGRPAAVVRAHGITALVTGDAPESDLLRVAGEVAQST